MKVPIKKMAYGVSDFQRIQQEHHYFVDKTHFIPILEENSYVFLIRPRRFGKSLWISILETYYDISQKDQFLQFFGNTWIGQNATEEQGSYLVLTFNFSAVHGDLEEVVSSFEAYGRIQIHSFLNKYQEWFPSHAVESIKQETRVSTKLSALFEIAAKQKLNLYVLVDEYDNFANTILSTTGESAYQKLTQGEGLYRHFFSVLKEGTSKSGAGLKRLFITGVSPIVMDDVTSGFNIGKNISLSPQFNEMTGFSQSEVLTMLTYYQQLGRFQQDTQVSLELMKFWYDNYCFCKTKSTSLFNPDMVIYFVQESIQLGTPPEYLIDQNIRIDYGKLRHLLIVSKKLNGNFDRLKAIVENNGIISDLTPSFPLERLAQPENFISLLYYFGLLSIAGIKRGLPLLIIPNYTVRSLIYGYIREAYQEAGAFQVDFLKLMDLFGRMAYDGEWENFFDCLANEIQKQTRIRDYLSAEKVIQGFLLAYLSISDYYLCHTEKELNKGFADIFLEPFLVKYPDLPYVYVIELKYIRRSEFTKTLLQEKIDEAEQQIIQYLKDDMLQNEYASHQIRGIVLVFNGWELVYRQDHSLVKTTQESAS